MEPSPFFCPGGKQVKPTDFFRNPWCSHYDTCLDRAARDDLYLDCTHCEYRDNIIEGFSLLLGRAE